MRVEDLDVLRPEARFVKIGDKEIDVSFIPCGITFDIDSIMRELGQIDQKKILENGEETEKAFDLSIKLCAIFCEHKYPEMNEQWFRWNADVFQVKAFSDAIQEALSRAYAGVETSSKNLKAPRTKK